MCPLALSDCFYDISLPQIETATPPIQSKYPRYILLLFKSKANYFLQLGLNIEFSLNVTITWMVLFMQPSNRNLNKSNSRSVEQNTHIIVCNETNNSLFGTLVTMDSVYGLCDTESFQSKWQFKFHTEYTFFFYS